MCWCVAKGKMYQVNTSYVIFILSGVCVGLDKIVLNRMFIGASPHASQLIII